jgi:hypothetical protein
MTNPKHRAVNPLEPPDPDPVTWTGVRDSEWQQMDEAQRRAQIEKTLVDQPKDTEIFDERGKFRKGHHQMAPWVDIKLTRKQVTEHLLTQMANAFTAPETLAQIFAALKIKALEGDLPTIEFIFAYLIGKPIQRQMIELHEIAKTYVGVSPDDWDKIQTPPTTIDVTPPPDA